MGYNIKVKNGIAFNLDDPFQFEQYTHICKIPNVSAYVKRLIAMDMMGTWKGSNVSGGVEQLQETVEVNDDLMLGVI